VTKRPITIEKLPTVADLRARRLELTGAALREILADGADLEAFQAVVEPLSAEFDLYKVALAAVKLAHEATGSPRDEEELPEIELPSNDERRGGRSGNGSGREPFRGNGRGPRRGRGATAGTTRLFVGTGRAAGVRPQDLVGAITGKSYLNGRDIGSIEIADKFSLVEVPESAADDVVAALRQAGIRGRTATVRRERYEAR
jgi:ATP-dependent RNA helicase DeaD